jgi:3-hydroxybutyryl-CoA dehydrogenase
MGPLRLTDLVGLDVRLAIADHLHDTLGGDTYKAPELLREKVARGELGKKTGRGFYTWEKER